MGKKMKIVQFTDTYLPTMDGVISVVKNYCESINEKQDCELVACSQSKKSKYVDEKKFKILRIKSMRAPEGYRYGLPFMDRKLKKYLKQEDFDVFHAHTPFSLGKIATRYANKRNIPIVATLHTQYHQDFERVLGKWNKPLIKFMIWYIMRVYNRADSVWTVSNTSKKFLRQYGYKGEIQVVRNATDYTYPENDKELIEKINQLHNLEGQKNVFLFVGRMAFYKNLKLLCSSLKILKEKGEDFKMLFVGGGFDLDRIIKFAEELGIADKCIFTGGVNDRQLLQGYYLRADLLLFPSVFDMASIVQMEASAHKTPALVIENSCAQEQIIHGENGFVSAESDVDYAEKLIEAVADPVRLKQVGENAYNTLYRTWNDVAEEVIAKYQEIIEKKKQEKIKKEKKKG